VLIGNGNHDLHYLLAWESLAEREKKWGAFMSDPAWISARADSEKDGPILANVNSMIPAGRRRSRRSNSVKLPGRDGGSACRQAFGVTNACGFGRVHL
jgi:hypothetical protein